MRRVADSDVASILIVDDDDAIRALVARVLRREQYEVAQAVNGRDALEQLRGRRRDVVVLDLMMPVMTGFELIDYLDAHDDAGRPCVIVVSATSETELKTVASQNVHSVLRKPFDLTTLIGAVRSCTDHREAPPRQ
jgi:CheY-like chemotaxis protein